MCGDLQLDLDLQKRIHERHPDRHLVAKVSCPADPEDYFCAPLKLLLFCLSQSPA
jgi:hypothetical protein